jgi:hypothetical protein
MRLIDADELKERAHEMIFEDSDALNGGRYCEAVTVGEIDEVPTIEAVPVVHGEWLIKEDESCFATWDYCSVCGFEMGFAGSSHYANFCPNCGAKMRTK